ncbi:MAG: hypothetical protein A3F67_01780 [Verrucomicrobia bacterium RIFCSPHIGHO2_12_FULL_41_10]|nr:MAG: hypothetical protein A3F67_01780 [Verrucomicrobia bacterium RIFCSPHIGHO2_12_FULL_41_10]HLB34017.1 hypothetical protein [Chthoniobacterales bacterium]
MRTTIDIDLELLTKARAFALKEQCTFQSLITEGLSYVLQSKLVKKNSQPPSHIHLTTSSVVGGLRSKVNLNSNAALRDLMDLR